MAEAKLTPPCRVYVILAREAPVAVIFRRGPSKWVQVIHWNTETDMFTPGQWFHGRVYEKRSDLSPSGALLIYAARKEKAYTHRDKEYMPSWTAISRPPYLTALALWPCFWSFGGGLFFSDTKVWLNHGEHREPHSGHPPHGVYVYHSANDASEEALLTRRLERGGWRHTQEWRGEIAHLDAATGRITARSHYINHAPGIHEKPHPSQNVALLLTTTRSGFQHQYRYSIRQESGEILYFNDAEWADWDMHGRLVLAQNGGIFAQDAVVIGHEPPVELINLNGNTPEPVVAPNWAKVW